MIGEDKSNLFRHSENMFRINNFIIVLDNIPYDLYIAVYIKKKTFRHNYIFKDGKFIRIFKRDLKNTLLSIENAKERFPQYFI